MTDSKNEYKNTPLGKIPSNWKIVEFKDVLEYEQPSKYLTKDINEKSELNLTPVLTANKAFILGYSSEANNVYETQQPIIIFDDFTTSCKYVDFNFKVKSSAIKILYTRQNDNVKFLYEKLNSIKINTDDHKRRWISEFQEMAIALPPIQEQNKIADISSKWDNCLELNLGVLNALVRQRNIFIANLMLKSTSSRSVSQVVVKIRNGFTPKPDALYQEIGIRSHAKGIFHKEPVTGKSLGNKSVFWVEPDCFVVNIVFAWEQAVAKTTEAEVGMIASHRFPMFKPKEGVLDLDYLLYFFKSAKGKNLLELASPGGAGRNKTLGQSEFLKLKIPVPSIEEQKKIVRLLNAADKEIELQKQKIEAIKFQKKGLMQQLLTGKKRIKL
ncbi:restriction endonuclease subunit S [Elizabethkingia anophelis]|uniref:restriction endonuclease subunit S n=1 Tax=Elizabethkingia anophelis TaxID=1117645 RepID=UPI003786F99D